MTHITCSSIEKTT